MVVQLNIPVAPLLLHFLHLVDILAECLCAEFLCFQMVVQLLFSHLLLVLAEKMLVVFAALQFRRRNLFLGHLLIKG